MSPKTLVSVFVAIFLSLAALSFAGEYRATQNAGDLEVTLAIDRNPPVVGKNTVTIAIKEKNGTTVTDAAVRLEYGMAAMPGMPAMNYKSDAALDGNAYKAPMTLSMPGPWYISAKILRANKVVTAKYNVDAQ